MGACLLAWGVGCSRADDKVLKAWESGGQTVSEFAKVEGRLEGGECREGRVSGLEALVCRFDGKDAATQAEDAAWKLVGSDVGSVLVRDRWLLMVSDPRKEDPSGRRINDVVETFRAQVD